MKKIIILFALCSHFMFFACQEEERGQYPIDSNPPGKIKSFEVENIEGGAVITYVLPDDEDILFVKAIYKLDNGTPMEVISSMYTNNLVVEGIGKSKELWVDLIVVDRSRNESVPVVAKIHPLDAPLYSILSSMVIRNDFGGISLNWTNLTGAPVVIEVLTQNDAGETIVADKFYTEAKSGKGNIRGYNPVERLFSVLVKDRWGNVTDTLSNVYLPIFEQQLDKKKFARWNPPGIPYNAYTTSNWYIENFWNNSITSGFANYSLEFTFDMGQLAKLSRFKINQRKETNLCYAHGHPKRFELWGSATPNVTEDFSTWKFIGSFESVKPSRLPLGQVSNEDIDYAHTNGEEWNVSLDAPNIRYIRFTCQETWGQANLIQVMEATFWGDTNVE